MITKIILNKVASYKSPTHLETDKKINLIYGLNGTGKSTLSNLLYNKECEIYENSKIEGLNSEDEIIVYNQKFIQENFFESETLKGIFTLSKENKDAKTKVDNAEKEIIQFRSQRKSYEDELKVKKAEFSSKYENAKSKIWEIKKNYTGGDRVLEFCLEGYINRESHSLGQNIFDIKEFNYSDFKEAFALVFKETGYEDHYKKMIR